MARQNWSDGEIHAIVDDYFDMLRHELAGLSYNKSEHRRTLKKTIDRSDSSIERKHMNISAVMSVLGLPYIKGYQPHRHYQRALFEAVETRLNRNRELYSSLTGEDIVPQSPSGESLSESSLEFDEAPPSREIPEQNVSEDIRRIIRRFEPPAERDARNRKLGKAGEEFVFETEKRRLYDIGRKDLSARVCWVARDKGDGYGYDILSYYGTGNQAEREQWLEIKTTTGPKTTPFFITRNELSVSGEHPDYFRLIRLYDFRRQARAYCLKPPLENHVQLSPTIYRATPKGTVEKARVGRD